MTATMMDDTPPCAASGFRSNDWLKACPPTSVNGVCKRTKGMRVLVGAYCTRTGACHNWGPTRAPVTRCASLLFTPFFPKRT